LKSQEIPGKRRYVGSVKKGNLDQVKKKGNLASGEKINSAFAKKGYPGSGKK